MTEGKSVYVFPGQGRDITERDIALLDCSPHETQMADDILGYSSKELVCGTASQVVKETVYAQPLIFLLNHLAYLHDATDTRFSYFIGHSLGEFNGLVAAGCLSFEDGLRIVKQRAELMSVACAEHHGGMSAVIGKNYQEIMDAIAQASPGGGISIANLNSPRQLVVSGLINDIAQFQDAIPKDKIRTVSLKVGGAFHSKYMSSANAAFAPYIDDNTFCSTDAFGKVISCVTARPYGDDAAETLRAHMVSQVNFIGAVEYAIEHDSYAFSIARSDSSFQRFVDDIKFDLIIRHQRRDSPWD